jgi:hypothetical protein
VGAPWAAFRAVAELKSGDAFGRRPGANAKRNATVTMLADGALLRLAGRTSTSC